MCMAHGAGLGAHPERIPKASRRYGGRGITQKRLQDDGGKEKPIEQRKAPR